MKRLLFWTAIAIALGLYAVMLLWSLPKITADAGGLPAFDMRPGGYSFEEAKQFLALLSEEGNAFYRTVQQRLDIPFPFFQALASGWAIYLLAPAPWGKWRTVLGLSALPGMVLDYVENAHVAELLRAGAEGITPQMVASASFYSQMKAVFVTAGMLVLVSMIVLRVVRRVRG